MSILSESDRIRILPRFWGKTSHDDSCVSCVRFITHYVAAIIRRRRIMAPTSWWPFYLIWCETVTLFSEMIRTPIMSTSDCWSELNVTSHLFLITSLICSLCTLYQLYIHEHILWYLFFKEIRAFSQILFVCTFCILLQRFPNILLYILVTFTFLFNFHMLPYFIKLSSV